MGEFYNRMAAKAARGENTGLMFVATDAQGEDEWGMCGAYTADLTRATRAARDGMAAFLEYRDELLGVRDFTQPAQNHEHIERLLREA